MRLEIKEDPTCLLFRMEEFDGYTRTVGAMADGGYRELSRRFWREGGCLGADPWRMHGEDGRLMDFISALRIA
ncbi:MAG: hypothetical protein FWG10_06275 [Eubacteriaceae bacterium]|nr:hypothetical protein [Eubacteriaceae bacterium]